MKKYGYIPSVVDEEVHYVMGDGSLSAKVLMLQGHGWGDYLPVDEIQYNQYIETNNCSNYGTLHALAPLGKFLFGPKFQTNLSERYTGVMSGTTLQGNDPHTVIEMIRTLSGVIPEVFLPFNNSITTWEKYYSPKPMSYNWFAVGRHWLKKYKVTHQWVVLPSYSLAQKQQNMKTALQYSPLGAAVYAWDQHADGLYYGNPTIHNHWVTVYDYVEGQYWLIFDSYDKTHKKLEWNFDFSHAKSYGLALNFGAENLGDNPESVKLSYATYFITTFLTGLFNKNKSE